MTFRDLAFMLIGAGGVLVFSFVLTLWVDPHPRPDGSGWSSRDWE